MNTALFTLSRVVFRHLRIQFLLLLLPVVVPFVAAQGTGAFRLPRYEKLELKNGLTIYLMEQHEVPLIYITATISAGATKDGRNSGLAYLTAESLLFGTKKYTKEAIEETVDFLGATLTTTASLEATFVKCSFAKQDQDQMLPILKEVILNPAFPASEVKKRQTRLLAQLNQAKESPQEVIDAYFARALFGDHPYGNPVHGTRESVAALRVEDLQRFYAGNYKPDASAIVVAGDFELRKMRSQIRKLFDDWQTSDTELVAGAATSERMSTMTSQAKILLINKPDATETTFQIGGLGVSRNNEDFVAIQVINTILGGRFTSWLNDELRVNTGLTYGARSFFNPHKQTGSFIISSYTRNATTTEALDLTLKVLEKLHTEGPDEKTLASARSYVKGQFPPRYETAGQLTDLLAQMFLYGFDESYIDTFGQRVDELTLPKAREVIQKYFPRNQLTFVLIGKSSEIREKVQKYGEVVEKEIKAEGF